MRIVASANATKDSDAAELPTLGQAARMAMVAHELRGPLNSIRTAAALLTRLPGGETARLQSGIERQVRRMSRMIEDLLDATRPGVVGWRIDRQMESLGRLAADAVECCAGAIELRRQTLHVVLPNPDVCLLCDALRIVQILSNLLDNASKYTSDGGSIGMLVSAADGREVVITVSDCGIGITPAALEHVFEPFVREVHAARFNASGLGLGLAVVRELVESHGGRVVAASEGTGCGSRFVVTLPLHGG